MNTPWGESQTIENVALGIDFISTASHGGYMLSQERSDTMPNELKPFTGNRRYWEEDCDAALVAVMFSRDMKLSLDADNQARQSVKLIFGQTALDCIDRRNGYLPRGTG